MVGIAGGGLALLEVDRGEAPGVRLEDQEGIDRTRPIHRLVLDGARPRCFPARRGGDVAARVLDAGLVALAADAFGAAWRLVQLTVEYARDRQQFGLPIAQFQAVKHRWPDMGTEIEPTRGLFWYAAHALDEGLTTRPRTPPSPRRTSASARSRSRGTPSSCTAASASPGSATSRSGSSARCSTAAFLGTPEHHRERMRRRWRAGRRGSMDLRYGEEYEALPRGAARLPRAAGPSTGDEAELAAGTSRRRSSASAASSAATSTATSRPSTAARGQRAGRR